jgi:hypothetical protein
VTRRIARAAASAASIIGPGSAAAVFAACLSVPPYSPPTLVSYAEADGGATVEADGFQLHFAGGSGFHFPDSLRYGSAELIGSDTAARCLDESGAGFLLFPTPRISGDAAATPNESTLTAVLRGPAVVQVRLDWNLRFACEPQRMPSGTSTFTIFPDARIVRHDVLADTNQVRLSAAACQCTTPTMSEKDKFFVSSFWSFNNAGFVKAGALDGKRDPDAPVPLDYPLPTNKAPVTGYATVCLDGPIGAGYHVASTWSVPSGADSPVLFGRDKLLAHDLQKPLDTSKLDIPWDIHGALIPDKISCTSAFRRALTHAGPPDLALDGAKLTASPLDGLYGGDDGTGAAGIAVGGRATLTGESGSPFAVRLKFSSAVELPRATRAGATGAWYVPQRIDDRDWILWFQDPLTAGESIVVESE